MTDAEQSEAVRLYELAVKTLYPSYDDWDADREGEELVIQANAHAGDEACSLATQYLVPSAATIQASKTYDSYDHYIATLAYYVETICQGSVNKQANINANPADYI